MAGARPGTHADMDERRSTWGATIRLAVTWSVLAVMAAIVLAAVDVSETVIVLSVIVIGFATSLLRTSHEVTRRPTAHRVVRVPVQHSHPVG